MGEELSFGLELAFHQRPTNKQLPRLLGRNRPVMDATARHNRQAKQSDLFKRHDLRALHFPMGFAIATFHQMLRLGLDPLRVDLCDGARKQLGGFNQLKGHDPFGCFFRQPRARVNHKLAVTCTKVLSILKQRAQVGEQARQQRLVQLAGCFSPCLLGLLFALVLITRQRRRYLNVHIPQQLAQLAEGIVPLAHAQVVNIVLTTPAAQLVARQCLTGILDAMPQV